MTTPTLSGEFLAAALAAPPDRIVDALQVLKGEAVTTSADDRPLLLTVSEAARRLNLSRNTVRRVIKEGRLRKVEIYAGSYRLRRLDVEALAAGVAR